MGHIRRFVCAELQNAFLSKDGQGRFPTTGHFITTGDPMWGVFETMQEQGDGKFDFLAIEAPTTWVDKTEHKILYIFQNIEVKKVSEKRWPFPIKYEFKAEDYHIFRLD